MKILVSLLFLCFYLFGGIFDFDTIQSNFKQTITNEQNKQITYEGNFYARADSKALWIYKKPIEKNIYFNQREVVIVEPELEQAIVTSLEKTPNIASILKDAKEVQKDTYETMYDDVKYEIHTQNGKILKISYKDKLENSVVIELTNQTINTFLDDVLFQPNIPQNYDIIMQ